MSEASTKPACPTDEELVSFLAGRSSPERNREISSHIAACQDCRDWLGGMRSASDARAEARSQFRFWTVAATVVGVVLIVLIVLVVVAGQKMEKLVEQSPRSAAPLIPALVRVIPERSIEPGKVFPVYQLGEELRVERVQMASDGARSVFYELDPGKGIRRMPLKSGEALEKPRHRGLMFYLLVDFPRERSDNDIAEFEKSIGEFVHRSQPLIILNSVDPWLALRGWGHQLISIEWED